jgi:flagellar L-ring protein precursor FlgH
MLTILLASRPANAGSLFLKAERNLTKHNLFADDKAANIGDVLTITIKEESKVDTKKKRTLEKETNATGEAGGQFDLGDLFNGWFKPERVVGLETPFQLPNADYNIAATNDFDGKADTSDSHTYEDQITVVVEDVMPNGNLLVLGKRTREVAGNKQIIQASGIVRTSDIDATNTIASERVANFHIVYINRGLESNYMRPGWLMRVWSLLSPF